MIESLLLAVTHVLTFAPGRPSTNATGFFFERDERLFLVTSRHVVLDELSEHRPDRIEIELHVDRENVANTRQFSLLLYWEGVPVWREHRDAGGLVDVVAIEIQREALPANLLLQAFSPAHLLTDLEQMEVGADLRIAGFPLGFLDTLHRLPIVRQAVIASSFGIRFQGQGYFLTDARMHRGTSGAPVVARALGAASGRAELPWHLLGIHATRFDMHDRDVEQDERLSLNCAWYADVLMQLTSGDRE